MDASPSPPLTLGPGSLAFLYLDQIGSSFTLHYCPGAFAGQLELAEHEHLKAPGAFPRCTASVRSSSHISTIKLLRTITIISNKHCTALHSSPKPLPTLPR